MIETTTKHQIAAELTRFAAIQGSDVKAGKAIDVSNATVSNARRGIWDGISDAMWRKIAHGIGFELSTHADTSVFSKLKENLDKAKEQAVVLAITCKEGGGKTYTLDRYRTQTPCVIYYKCNRFTTAKEFMQGIFKSMGINFVRGHIGKLLNDLKDHVSRMEKPLFIIDEIEKTKNEILHLTIDLYNVLDGLAGIVYLGTPYLKTRVENGVERGYMCFPEIFSRFGGKIIELTPPTDDDAIKVINARGIDDLETVYAIVNDSKNRNDQIDLRRVDRLCLAVTLKRANAA